MNINQRSQNHIKNNTSSLVDWKLKCEQMVLTKDASEPEFSET